MYRIKITSKSHLVPEYRYCFTKKSAMSLISIFIKFGCGVRVEKLIRLHHDIFCWSDEEDDKVFDYFYKICNEEDF